MYGNAEKSGHCIYIAPPCEPVASPDILKELIDLTLKVTN